MATVTKEKIDVYQIVTNRIIEHLEKGVIPWRRTWANVGLARNYVSGNTYRGINALLLNITGHFVPCFLTIRQVNRLGGKVKKGSKGEQVIYYNKRFKDQNGKVIDEEAAGKMNKDDVTIQSFARYYYVFNVADVEGVRFTFPNFELMPNECLEQCEKLIISIPDKPEFIQENATDCYYSGKRDIINLPPIEHFESSENYYNVLFHELIHSTGHKNRLNRDSFTGSVRFGDTLGSEEEVIAELGAAFLSCMTGIDYEPIVENSASYIQGWLKRLREDKKFIFTASSRAQQAVDYLTKNYTSSITHPTA